MSNNTILTDYHNDSNTNIDIDYSIKSNNNTNTNTTIADNNPILLCTSFDSRKSTMLSDLYNNSNDYSPKGSIDIPILELVNTINNTSTDYYTTSSCSGRISIFQHSIDKSKGGKWLLIEHGPINIQQVQSAITAATAATAIASGPVVFRFEPFILSIACRSLSAANRLLSLSISSGFRESGIAALHINQSDTAASTASTNSNNTSNTINRPIMLSIRCSIRIETTIIQSQQLLVNEQYLLYLVEEANRKWINNCKRFQLLHTELIKLFNNINNTTTINSNSNNTTILSTIDSTVLEQRQTKLLNQVDLLLNRTVLLRDSISSNNMNQSINNWPTLTNSVWALVCPRNLTKYLSTACRELDWNDRNSINARKVSTVSAGLNQSINIEYLAIPINTIAVQQCQSALNNKQSLIQLLQLDSKLFKESDIQLRLVQLPLLHPNNNTNNSNNSNSNNNITNQSSNSISNNNNILISDPKRRLRLVIEELLNQSEYSIGLKSAGIDIQTLLTDLPSKWEQLGDLLLIPSSAFKHQYWKSLNPTILWPIVLSVFPNITRLARQAELIPDDILRHSRVELLYTDSRLGLVEHRENGVIYSLDVTESMFSSGNISEKQRLMGLINQSQLPNEVIVDLYAGIGYFTLPVLVHCKSVSHIHACEWNPPSVTALQRNLVLNHIPTNRCTVYPGDNRSIDLQSKLINIADRVLLGLLPSSEPGYSLAINAIKPTGGILHIHSNVVDKTRNEWIQKLIIQLQSILAQQSNPHKQQLQIKVLHTERVKWFAPRIMHIVVDILLYQSTNPNPALSTNINTNTESVSNPIYSQLPLPTKRVSIYNNPTTEQFWNEIFIKAEPAVLRGLDLGNSSIFTAESLLNICTDNNSTSTNTDSDYYSSLSNSIVSVHVCPSSSMDFLNRNYIFKTMPFTELIQRIFNRQQNNNNDSNAAAATATPATVDNYFISPNERYYLRSLGSNPRKEVANFNQFLPQLAKHFNPPELLSANNNNNNTNNPNYSVFSSVFRCSSPDLSLFNHYDITDNILCHLTGSKQIILFPPTEAQNLYLSPEINSSTSPVLIQYNINTDTDTVSVDLQQYPLFESALLQSQLIELEAGDCLFIPSLWFHSVYSRTFTISTNIFFKTLESKLYELKDLYGNKDLLPANRAIKLIESIHTELNSLPEKFKLFYLQKIKQLLQL